MNKLSARQQEIYDFIVQYREAQGYPPAQQEIADALNISQQTVRNHLIALSKKGYIIWTENIPRSIQVTMQKK